VEYFKARAPVPTLPAGTPSEVQLLDHDWLTAQQARGARLALLRPEERDPEKELEEEELKLYETQSALTRLLGEAEQLRQNEAEGERLLREARTSLVALVSEAEELRERVRALEGERDAAREELDALRREGTQSESQQRAVGAALGSLQTEAWELQAALARAQRPLWKKLLRRS
jgi:chromosome segregation ATPase